MQLTYRHTRAACFVGYVTQAIVNNLSPLLFLTFQNQFGVSLSQISLIITVNFAIQMLVDLLSAHFLDKIGYRAAMVSAHALSAAGILGLSVLPMMMPPYPGLLIAAALSAVGGGLLEVAVSPVIEALPSDHKEKEMSLLHSFYCWGQVGVVLLSTVYFLSFGTAAWRYLPPIWALIPFFNGLVFLKTPLISPAEAGRDMPIGQLLVRPVFWLFLLLMVCSGASELAMSQWASFFAEAGLNVSKTMGDLMGPCAFALLMGSARLIFSKVSLSLKKGLLFGGCLCIVSYLITIFSPWPLLSLFGCALCGFSVGVMWPGTFSLATQYLPAGGTAMFALLALAGDVGCCAGPSLVGLVSDHVMGSAALAARFQHIFPMWRTLEDAALKSGFLLVVLFPMVLMFGVLLLRKKKSGGK